MSADMDESSFLMRPLLSRPKALPPRYEYAESRFVLAFFAALALVCGSLVFYVPRKEWSGISSPALCRTRNRAGARTVAPSRQTRAAQARGSRSWRFRCIPCGPAVTPRPRSCARPWPAGPPLWPPLPCRPPCTCILSASTSSPCTCARSRWSAF
jgi:hypothetical protein